MTRRKLYDIEALSGELYDMLAGAPIACEHGIRGYEAKEITDKLGVPRQITSKVIRAQRLLFGDDDEINIPYHVCGRRRIYQLSGSIEASQRWNTIRMRDERSRTEVSIAFWQSMLRAHPTDGYAKLNLAACREILTRINLLLGELPI